MRRKDREITDKKIIEDILHQSKVCRIAMVDENNMPYVVPMSFGYQDDVLYLHCAKEGKKIDILKHNNNVCFEVDIDCEVVFKEPACQSTMLYKSVIGFGKAYFIDSVQEKRKALNLLVSHYKANISKEIPEQMLNATTVIKIEIESKTGKANPAIGN